MLGGTSSTSSTSKLLYARLTAPQLRPWCSTAAGGSPSACSRTGTWGAARRAATSRTAHDGLSTAPCAYIDITIIGSQPWSFPLQQKYIHAWPQQFKSIITSRMDHQYSSSANSQSHQMQSHNEQVEEGSAGAPVPREGERERGDTGRHIINIINIISKLLCDRLTEHEFRPWCSTAAGGSPSARLCTGTWGAARRPAASRTEKGDTTGYPLRHHVHISILLLLAVSRGHLGCSKSTYTHHGRSSSRALVSLAGWTTNTPVVQVAN